MSSWGELWDKKQQLASNVFNNQNTIEAEKIAILKLAKDSQPEVDESFKLEVRAQGLMHGVVANNDQVEEGRKYLRTSTFPSLSKLGTDEGQKSIFSAKAWEFMNDCHNPDDGTFCEGTSTSEAPAEKKGFFKKIFGKDAEGKSWQDRKNAQFEKIVEAEKVKKNTYVEPKIDPNAPVISTDTTKNAFGFSPQDLDLEKASIASQFKKGEKLHLLRLDNSTKWQDNVDAETRANAVMQGRIATKGEIKKGRSKAASQNWGGLIFLGILAK